MACAINAFMYLTIKHKGLRLPCKRPRKKQKVVEQNFEESYWPILLYFTFADDIVGFSIKGITNIFFEYHSSHFDQCSSTSRLIIYTLVKNLI